jgi:hypothetical protein
MARPRPPRKSPGNSADDGLLAKSTVPRASKMAREIMTGQREPFPAPAPGVFETGLSGTAVGMLTPQERAALPEDLRDLAPDDEITVVMDTSGSETPPDGAGAYLGTLSTGGSAADGTRFPPGARIYRSARDVTRAEIEADPRATGITFGGTPPGEIPAAFRRRKPGDDEIAPGAAIPARFAGAANQALARKERGIAPYDTPGLSVEELRALGVDPDALQAEREQQRVRDGITVTGAARHIRPGGAPSGIDASEALRESDPELAAMLARGLGPEELAANAGRIAQAISGREAVPGAKVFTGDGDARVPGGTIRARAILGGTRNDGTPGLPDGLLPGDMIATEQPLGYADAGVELPAGMHAEPGSRVWRPVPDSGNIAEAYRQVQAWQDPSGPAQKFAPLTAEQYGALLERERGEARQGPAETARALAAAGGLDLGQPAPLGQSKVGIGGPELIITDSLNNVPDDDDTLVIEDMDPSDPDAGRIMVGSAASVRKHHAAAEASRLKAMLLAPDLLGPVRDPGTAAQVPVRTRWTAGEVLDFHAWLAKHYRPASPDLAGYLAFIMNKQVREAPKSASMFWPVDLADGADDQAHGIRLGQVIARGLADGHTYQVTEAMCDVMRDDLSRQALPLDEGELPAAAGFAWLDRPQLIRDDDGVLFPARAISWEKTVAYVKRGTGGTAAADAVRAVVWVLGADLLAFGHWADPAKAAYAAVRVGRLVPQEVILMPFGLASPVNPSHTGMLGMLGLLHTLWHYLGMELAASRPVRPGARATQQRAAKSLRHDLVHVITLRRISYIGDAIPGPSRVTDWTCRWWVGEFYRHIDKYEDVDDAGRRRRHEATPAERTGYVADDPDHDICAVCHAKGQTVRITLVRSHARGPSDKPFRTLAKERTLSRLSR